MSTAVDAAFSTMATNIGYVGANKYDSGRSQGHSDVMNTPNAYSLYTQAQYTANYNSGYSAGYGAGGATVDRSLSQTYTLNPSGNNKWGAETITFTFPAAIVGMYAFSQTAIAGYCYLTGISISGTQINMTFEHAHGVNTPTNTVTVYCRCRG